MSTACRVLNSGDFSDRYIHVLVQEIVEYVAMSCMLRCIDHEIREREREREGEGSEEMRCGFLLFVFFCFLLLILYFSFCFLFFCFLSFTFIFSFVSGFVFRDVQLYRLVIL